MKNIAVLFGGKSPEHDVSIITGVLTLNSLSKTEYNPIPIFVNKKGLFYTGQKLFDLDEYKNLSEKCLKAVTFLPSDNTLYEKNKNKLKSLLKISAIINCMHGGDGENGNFSGLIESLGVALCSPDALSSALFMDKEKTKHALKGIGVCTLGGVAVSKASVTEREVEKLGYPLIVKPLDAGSSIGIKTANCYEELAPAISYALKYSSIAIIEPCLKDFTEINCAVYKNALGDLVVSECEKPIGRTEILSFNDKYVSGKREFPAKITKGLSDKIKTIAKKIYSSYFSVGVIRIDFFVYGGKIYVNEVNTVPGSLAYYLFCDTLKEFSEMLTELIKAGELRYNKKRALSYDYGSGILSGLGNKGAKRLKKN